jgi:aminoglycoside phosphotransferase (APT) family kinase protein
MQPNLEQLEAYLAAVEGQPVSIGEVSQLGGGRSGATALKAFGYGRPLRIDYQVGGAGRRVVLRQVQRNGFGREMGADRVAAVWLDFQTFNRLPRHIAVRDLVGLDADGRLESLGRLRDVWLLTDYEPGRPYAEDLVRIRDEDDYSDQDAARAEALARYLARIHAIKCDDPLLWRRRLRDLIGHGEGIMGLTDSYPADFPLATGEDWLALEAAANRWRWRLKPLNHRLSQVHGDFHPFNILFPAGGDRSPVALRLIDRSRGEWGEPADDVSCLSINYLFFSLQRYDCLAGPFAELYRRFWERYLAQSGDEEVTAVIQPWYAWRALVLASPQWYPTLSDEARRKLLAFAHHVMAESRFQWQDVNRYL